MRKGHGRYEKYVNEGFPGWLSERLVDRNWLIADLAKASGLTGSLISRWMSGRQQPSPESLLAVSQALHVDITEVLTQAGYLPPKAQIKDPRRVELHRRLEHLELTHERYLALNALLVAMEAATAAQDRLRGRDTPAVVVEVPAHVRPQDDHPPANEPPPQSEIETGALQTAYVPT